MLEVRVISIFSNHNHCILFITWQYYFFLSQLKPLHSQSRIRDVWPAQWFKTTRTTSRTCSQYRLLSSPHWKDLETITPPLITSIKALGRAVSTDCLVEKELEAMSWKFTGFTDIRKTQRNSVPYFPASSLSGCLKKYIKYSQSLENCTKSSPTHQLERSSGALSGCAEIRKGNSEEVVSLSTYLSFHS